MYVFTRQLPSSFTELFSSIYSRLGAKLLLFIVGDLRTSVNSPLDFHNEIFLVLLIF